MTDPPTLPDRLAPAARAQLDLARSTYDLCARGLADAPWPERYGAALRSLGVAAGRLWGDYDRPMGAHLDARDVAAFALYLAAEDLRVVGSGARVGPRVAGTWAALGGVLGLVAAALERVDGPDAPGAGAPRPYFRALVRLDAARADLGWHVAHAGPDRGLAALVVAARALDVAALGYAAAGHGLDGTGVYVDACDTACAAAARPTASDALRAVRDELGAVAGAVLAAVEATASATASTVERAFARWFAVAAPRRPGSTP